MENRLLLAVTVVDPADGLRLMNSQVLGNWSTAGNYDGWTVANAASSSVTAGNLTVASKTSGNPVQISLNNIANGPFLDYGYFDYLQVKMELPANFNQPIVFSFGTSTHSGFSSSRQFAIPANQVATDGQFHTYRLDLGLTVWWKDTLTDLQMQPLGSTSAGQTAIINYVEVGDLPGDVLTMTTASLGIAPSVNMANAVCVQSKHYAFWYDPVDSGANPGGQTNWSTMANNVLTMLEECYQVYTKVQGYQEPFHWAGDGIRHKVNCTCWYGGYWMSGVQVNFDTSGLQDQGPGNPVPHEYGHFVDGQQPGFISGGDWESHANWHRESWIEWFSPYFAAQYGTQYQSTVGLGELQWSNWRQDTPRLIYADYRVFAAMQNFDPGLEAQMWEQGPQNMTVWDKLALILPSNENVEDVAAAAESHWPMLDFVVMDGNGGTASMGSLMRAALWDNATDQANFMYLTTTTLTPEADNPGWYTVPTERAPEKYAFDWSWLTPTAQTVTVNLQGINTIDPTQDWRWCLEEVDSNYNVTYSAVWAPGTHSYTMNNINDRLILFVMATPSNTAEDLGAIYNTKPNGKNVDRLNYPYQVQISGAAPGMGATQQLGYARSLSGSYHKNPDGSTGGWVDSTASVASTAYLGPHAEVLGSARVLGSASVQDYAVICGSAVVQGSAIVSGYAVVRDSANVTGSAVVRDHATVASSSLVQGSAQIEDYAYLTDNATYTDSTIARGDVFPVAGGTYSGTTILDYDYSFNWSETTGVHQGHFPWGVNDFQHSFDQTQVTPANLIASYTCSEPSGDLLWDEFGCEQAWLRGGPALVGDANFQTDVLQFNGSSQWVDLNSNLADLSASTYAFWVDPTSSTANQALLYFGGSTGNYLELTARDANGYAHLTMSVGGVVKQLVSTTAVPLNQWTNIALSFGSGTATFYINGVAAGSAALGTSYVPRNVLGPNDLVAAQGFYLGRDASGNYFTGRMNDMRFYNATLSQAQVQNEMQRSGALLGLFFNNAPMTFDGATTTYNSGVRNGLARTLEATINPMASPNEGSFYQPIFDSNYQYGSNQGTTFQGDGLGLNNGNFYVLLDGYGMWNTGVAVTLNAWQTVAVTFNGSVANFYESNGTTWVKQATLNYTADPNSIWNVNYRIGYGLAEGDAGNSTNAIQTFFQGQIENAKIYDRVVITDPGTYSWDTSSTGGYQGGSGTWNATNTNWSNGSGTAPAAWPGGTASTAAFDTGTSGSSYTVTVSGNPSPYAISFGDENQLATDQFTLAGGTLSVGGGGISDYVTGAVNSAVTLTAAQTWQTALGQTLTVGGSVNTGGYALTVEPGTQFPFRWNFGGALNTAVSSGSGATVLSGGLTSNGSLTMNGTGILTLSGASTYSGGTTLNNGTTVLANTSGSAAGTGPITVAAGATLRFGNGDATGSAGSIAITNSGLLVFDRSDSFIEGGLLSGNGNLTQMGPGSLTLTAANTFGGPTQIARGGLVVGNPLALQNSTVNYATAGTTLGFASGVTSATLGGLSGSNNLSLQNASSSAVALTVGGNNQSTNFSGQLTGTGSLTKTGSGVLTLAATNTYSGGTIVSGGTLLVNNTSGSGLGTGSVSVNNGGTLAGSGAISGAVSVAGGGTLAASPGTAGTWTLGGLQLATNSTVCLEFSGAANDTIAVANAAGLTINGGGINLYQPGTTTAFAAIGTYQLFTHSGAIGGSGVGSLTVLNKAPGYRYSLSDTGTAVVLTIARGPLWSGSSGGLWSDAANWSGVAPTASEPLVYATPGNLGGSSVNDQTNASYPSAVFNVGAASFTLSGNAVTLTGDANGNLVQNLSGNAQTLALPITVGATGALNATSGPIVLGSAGNIATSAGKGLTILGTNSVTLAGTVSGAGGVTDNATSGTLNLNSANALGSGTFTINGGTIDNTSGAAVSIATNSAQTWNGNFTFNGTNNLNLGSGGVNMAAPTTVTTNAGTLTVGGNIANASSNPLTKSGAGTLVLQNGSVTLSPSLFEFIYNGNVVLNNYSVNWTNDTAWEHVLYGPQSSTSLTLQNGSTFLGNNVLLADDNNGGTLSIYDTSRFQTQSGWDLEITRRGNATVNQNGGTVEVGGNLDYNNYWGSGNCAGVYNLDAGTLLLHNGIVVQSLTTSTFNFGGGTLQFSNSQTVGGLNTMAIYAAGNALGNSTATGGAVVNTNGSATTATFNQLLTNGNSGIDGGLTKVGAGKLVLTQANTYTGPTTVSGGTLLVNNTSGSGTGTGAVTDNDALGGTGTIAGAVTVGSGGTLAPGSGGIGTLTVNGAVSLAGTTTMEISKSGTTLTSDKVQDGAALTYGGTLTITKLSGGTALVSGDIFTLFSATSYLGHFTAFNLPTLSSGLQWNLSNLAVNGSVSVIISNNPQVAVPAAAVLAANGKTASLSVLGNDNGGESKLTYTWSCTGPSGVTYSANGSNTAKNTTATFTQTGSYTFTVTIKNSGGYTNTSAVTLIVGQVGSSVVIAPGSVALASHAAQNFTANVTDQFGVAISSPTVVWSAVTGNISSGGAYTAPYAAGGDTVSAASGIAVGTASVSITNAAPTVATSATADGNSPDMVSSTTAALRVLGADSDGGGESNLTYTWSASGPAAVNYTVAGGSNGTNAAKNATATFSKAGSYQFTVTITDGGGLAVSSNVNVTVNQTATSVGVWPNSVTVDPGLTTDPTSQRQFAASLLDQFALPMPGSPTWSTVGGLISSTGLFTPPTSGAATVTATIGTRSAAASVTVNQPYGWWKFDGNGNDSSGQATLHTATVTGGSYVPGEFGSAVQFDGTSSKVTFSSNPSLTGTGNFTVSAWIKTIATAAGVIIQQKNNGTTNGQYQLSTTASGAVQFWMRNGTNYQFNLTTSQTVRDGSWHQIVGVRNGANGYIYVDGVLATSGTSGGTLRSLNTNPVSIGADSSTSSTYFSGVIDDVRIYNSAVSGATIANLANTPPSIGTAAMADGMSPATVNGTSTYLTVLGADGGSAESTLDYTWSAASKPSGAADPTFSINGANSAKSTTATFSQAGAYTLTATIVDAGGRWTTSSVNVTVSQVFTSIAIGPTSANLGSGQTQQFAATGYDQFGAALASQPTFTWTKVSGTGSIDVGGLYSAGYASGSATIQAANGSIASNTVTVTITNAAPTVATVAKADGNSPATVSGVSTVLTVLGGDTDGGGEPNLSYNWSASGPAAVDFAANNSHAARHSTATFSMAGNYTFTVTITDLGGQSTTSSVDVAVQQVASSCSLSPSSANITAGATQQFKAAALDQFQDPMIVEPIWNWSADFGNIDSSGLYTPPYQPVTATVQVSGGGVNSKAAVKVVGEARWNATDGSPWTGSSSWVDSISGLPVAAPGLRGISGDTVLFAAAEGATVQMNGVSPTLAGITFDDAVHSYTLGAQAGSNLTLQADPGDSATVEVDSGNHVIGASLTLASSTNFDTAPGTSLTINGNITGGSLSKIGSGSLVLSGVNGYLGGTVVTAGKLVLGSPSAIADGTSLTIGAGAGLIFAPAFDQNTSGLMSASPAIVAGCTFTTVKSSDTTIPAFEPIIATLSSSKPSSESGPLYYEAFTARIDSARNGPITRTQWPATKLPGAPASQSSRVAMPGPLTTNRRFGSTSARSVAGNLEWLGQTTASVDSSEQHRKKDVAILALEAVFAQYAR